MNILAEPFWVPKYGNREDENDDAVCPQERRESDEGTAWFAVADGATESFYSGWWAKKLVEAVGRGFLLPDRLCERMVPLWEEWGQWIDGKDLPWYAEEKARQGAFAALVALELTDPELSEGSVGSWRAAALGDSCLFHMRDEKVQTCFPVDTSAGFNDRPFLLGSVEAKGEELAGQIIQREGKWLSGDIFFLMTDALAWWFLHESEAGNKPWNILRGFTLPEGAEYFRKWVGSLRDQKLIRNDDCTLLRIQIL